MWTAALAACAALLAPPQEEPLVEEPVETPLALRVNRAIARGVERLKAEQRPDGSWPGEEEPHPGGMSALVCYTLVKSGVPRSDASLARGLAALEGQAFESTYSGAVHLLLLESLRDPERHRAAAARSLALLVGAAANGLWPYPWGEPDMSNTQFALLGLRAAHLLGLEVPDDLLADCAAAVLRLQDESGGFRYVEGRAPTAGITAATLGGLAVIAQLAERRPASRVLSKHARDLRRAEDWLERHFSVERNQHGELCWTPSFHYPYLWAVERYCGLTERATLGGRDWYTEGAEYLVADQLADGGFGRGIPDTCFALLFLRRATFSTGGGEGLDASLAVDAASRAPELRPEAGVPQLTDWLLAGPFGGRPLDDPLAEPPFDPTRAKPRERAKLARREWERVTLKESGWTELEELTGRHGDHLLWVLAAEVANTGDEPVDAILWLTLEDGWRVYLDGELVSADRRVAAPIEETVRAPLALSPGEHTLLLLVEDMAGASAIAVRMTDADGRALPVGVDVAAKVGSR